MDDRFGVWTFGIFNSLHSKQLIHDRSADIYIFNIRISWQLVGISVAYGIIAIYTASSENTQKY